MGLRQRKYKQTRRRLVEAARELFEEHGYDGTTIEMIADKADVSPRTFHRYFETKAGVAVEPPRQIVAMVAANVRPDSSVLDLVDAMAAAMEEEFARGDIEWAIRLHRDVPTLAAEAPYFRQQWADEFAHSLAVADGRTEPEVFDRARASLAVGLVAIAVDEWILRRWNDNFGDVLKEVKDCFAERRTAT